MARIGGRAQSVMWFLEAHGVLGTVTFMACVPAAIYTASRLGHAVAGLTRWRLLQAGAAAAVGAAAGAFFGGVVHGVSSWCLGRPGEQIDLIFGAVAGLVLGLLGCVARISDEADRRRQQANQGLRESLLVLIAKKVEEQNREAGHDQPPAPRGAGRAT